LGLELEEIAESFIASKYPNFQQANLVPMDSANPDCGLYQELPNGVRYKYNYAECLVDEYTGQVYMYKAEYGSTPTISASPAVTQQQAEQIAIGHVQNLKYPDNSTPASVFLYSSYPASIGMKENSEVLGYTVYVVSSKTAGYNLSQYRDDVKSDDLHGVRLLVWINGATGSVGSCRQCEESYEPPSVATPAYSPDGGTYTGTQSVTISCSESGASIRYTTDGTKPTPTSTLYSTPVSVSTSQTLKARAFKTGFRSSLVKSADYVIQ